MKINTYNLIMKGLRKAAGETHGLNPCDAGYLQISYDLSDGEVLTDYHYSLGQNSWSVYRDPNIIFVCNADRQLTMQEIADKIADRMEYMAFTQI